MLKNLIPGICIIIISICFLTVDIRKMLIRQTGNTVSMKIIKKPAQNDCVFTKNTIKCMELEYNNKTYSVKLNKTRCIKYQVGDTINMKYLAQYSNYTVYPDSNISITLIIFASLLLFGIIYIPWVMHWHRKKDLL